MKKKNLLFTLIPLLTSCASAYDRQAVINEALLAVEKIQEVSYTKYKIDPQGHVIHFNEFVSGDSGDLREGRVPTGTITENSADFGRSFALRAPIRFNKDTFYPQDSSVSASSYAYNSIFSAITSNMDSINYMQFKSEDGKMIFYSANVNKQQAFYGVKNKDFDDYTVNSNRNPISVTVGSRFDYTLTYSSDGLLLEEKIVSKNDGKEDDSRSVNYQVNYTYE